MVFMIYNLVERIANVRDQYWMQSFCPIP